MSGFLFKVPIPPSLSPEAEVAVGDDVLEVAGQPRHRLLVLLAVVGVHQLRQVVSPAN